MSEENKTVAKKKIRKLSKSECEAILSRLSIAKEELSVYADHVRNRLKELSNP